MSGRQKRDASHPIGKAEYELLAEFRYRLRRFLRFSEEAARRSGLTPHQHQALLAIEGFPGRSHANVKELAERLQIKQNTAAELVHRLFQQGLVKREAIPADRRAVNVSVTRTGRALLRKLTIAHREELRRIEPALSDLLGRFMAFDGNDQGA